MRLSYIPPYWEEKMNIGTYWDETELFFSWEGGLCVGTYWDATDQLYPLCSQIDCNSIFSMTSSSKNNTRTFHGVFFVPLCWNSEKEDQWSELNTLASGMHSSIIWFTWPWWATFAYYKVWKSLQWRLTHHQDPTFTGIVSWFNHQGNYTIM